GILLGNKKILYSPPFQSKKRGQLILDKDEIRLLREKNLKKLKTILLNEYQEIFVNVGKDYLKLIEGFENLTNSPIIYASGNGIGPKTASMKHWIISSKE
ncbi:hypothetical protein ACFL96_19345, partial [Thermoproteota archaeon]